MKRPPEQTSAPPGVLMCLGTVLPPTMARKQINTGAVIGFHSDEIKHNLRMMAITIYNHQKLSLPYAAKVLRGKPTLPFFIYASHGLEMPSPHQTLDIGELERAPLLPLCYWESLYYAIVAEIPELYNDLYKKFKPEPGFVLHTHGWKCSEVNKPFTAFDFVSQLEEMWLACMDPRLLGPLENAVCVERVAIRYRTDHNEVIFRDHFEEDWLKLKPEEVDKALDLVKGMWDVSLLSPSDVVSTLWNKQAALISRACLENFNVNIDHVAQLAKRQAAVQIYSTFTNLRNPLQDGQTISHRGTGCSCPDECQCRLVCQFDISTATCACVKLGIKEKGDDHGPPQAPMSAEDFFDTEDAGFYSNRSIGAITSDLAQMQVAGWKSTQPTVQPSRQISETAKSTDHGYPGAHRDRSDTEKVGFPYVPTPNVQQRSKKDLYPLGFYGSDASRDPPVHRGPGGQLAPVYGPSAYSTAIPARKPVPQSSSSATTSSNPGHMLTPSMEWPRPLLLSSPSEVSSVAKITYPAIPQSTSKNFPTRSYPIDKAKNLREPVNEFAGWDTSHVKTPYLGPTIQPNFVGAPTQQPPFPLERHSADTPPPRRKLVSPTRMPNLRELSQMSPPAELPELEFNNPRPALKQRYVAAGGDAKLEDREEIKDFVLPKAETPWVTMVQPERLQMSHNAQGATPRKDSAAPTPWSGKGYPPSGMRSSQKADEAGQRENRDRSGSNTSRLAFKRLFSRQSGSSD